jgi:hypothetical protein
VELSWSGEFNYETGELAGFVVSGEAMRAASKAVKCIDSPVTTSAVGMGWRVVIDEAGSVAFGVESSVGTEAGAGEAVLARGDSDDPTKLVGQHRLEWIIVSVGKVFGFGVVISGTGVDTHVTQCTGWGWVSGEVGTVRGSGTGSV